MILTDIKYFKNWLRVKPLKRITLDTHSKNSERLLVSVNNKNQ